MDARPRYQFLWSLIAAACLAFGSLAETAYAANGPQWIWSPAQTGEIPTGSCYFRKTFEINRVESGEVQITADNAYQLYVNGRPVGSGEKWTQLDTYDITKFLVNGLNSVAVKVTNTESPDAGLVGQVIVKGEGGTHISYATNNSWLTALKELPKWNKTRCDDHEWLAARSIGAFGRTKPWFDEVTLAGGGMASRFKTQKDFAVEQVLSGEKSGSLICLTFNEFGEILAAQEGGPLLLLRSSKKNIADKEGAPKIAMHDEMTVYCDQVKSCQGILPLNGKVYVIGSGPSGPGMYRLSDNDNNGQAEKVELLIKFTGEMSEHGPHALSLGPDGLIYIVQGNNTEPDRVADASSPYRHYYEGDLLPKYYDPNGHANGIKVPGGRILRTDTEASFMEIYAGGLRNAYDLAFNKFGDLLTYDSDMEWDQGLPWYRPTRVLHILSGGEYGWRAGWSKMPDWQYDIIPPVAETGRGSPCGMTFYNHYIYPRRYHDAVFLGDWSRGRIVCLRFKPDNGSYKIEGETFVEGRPLNITDITVGPDGNLYFCTGGRATDGGVYRVVHSSGSATNAPDLGAGIEAALRQPQPDSAFARQQYAIVRQKLGDKWDQELTDVVANPASKVEHRMRGLDLMQLLGPFPTPQLLTKLSTDSSEQLRAKTAYMMGIHCDETLVPRLLKLMHDADPMVQRVACEALVRAGNKPDAKEILPLLKSDSPSVAWAATRLLETVPTETWRDSILKHDDARIFLQGGLALTRVNPDKATCQAILDRNLALMKGFLNDNDFLALLRLTELALLRGQLSADDMPELRTKLTDEYPSKDDRMNRELVRLLTFLQEPRATAMFLEQLRSTTLSNEEKLHIAFHAQYLKEWNTKQKFELLSYFETARTVANGHSYIGYIENVSRDFFVKFTEEERTQVLTGGTKWPSSALSVLAKLPAQPGRTVIGQIIDLDRQSVGNDGEAVRKLGIGIIAVLGRSGDEMSLAYLREAYARDPHRRGYIAMALAQHPNSENWSVLVESLSVVEGVFAQEVLAKLATVDHKPEKASAFRQVIIRGLKLGEGARPAIALLEKWTDATLGKPDDSVAGKLQQWQKWYAKKYPNEPEAALPVDDEQAKWTYQELVAYLDSAEAKQADPTRGKTVFMKARCAACHKHGDVGEGVGPDLTSVARRFQKKEILESVLYPSLVISDQYSSKQIELHDGRTVNGLANEQPDGSTVVLLSSGEKLTVAKRQIADIKPSKTSAMPHGLLNPLSMEEIGELFSFLQNQPNNSLTSRKAAAK